MRVYRCVHFAKVKEKTNKNKTRPPNSSSVESELKKDRDQFHLMNRYEFVNNGGK